MAMTNEERREYYRNNYAKHREKILAKVKAYYQNNKRKCNLWSAEYYAKHREELKAKRKERLNEIKHNHGETTD
jgi:hypothetical protein